MYQSYQLSEFMISVFIFRTVRHSQPDQFFIIRTVRNNRSSIQYLSTSTLMLSVFRLSSQYLPEFIYSYVCMFRGTSSRSAVAFPFAEIQHFVIRRLFSSNLMDFHVHVSAFSVYYEVYRAWKRGYLFYGPPGTGKSSLVAAMANYLKFDVNDLDLREVQCNSDLRRLLIGSANRSLLVIEDIDCNVGLKNRENENDTTEDDKITLSGLLNFIDGLWSSCGDERIIVFTTNHKDRLDPALLRPGRMDVHIEMSYCTFSGFRVLASNYLKVDEHRLFKAIEDLFRRVKVTPAEVAGELMKSNNANVALEGLVKFLQNKEREVMTRS
ncbi:hypothetical protein CQW23_23061 [Capsicum baccatum]|uniref:AAA+ ATPase domain-containing protein n=1 Tax=Capsicum baccatum TaxID=33114 RepID=A0A2G2W2P1_CAPBA|nr:hypothetical protein CQW23_23061 [Capsicum baccatum]